MLLRDILKGIPHSKYEKVIEKDGLVSLKKTKTKDSITCAYCGATKNDTSFFIGASKEPDWTMVEGTGKMTCPKCFEKAVAEGQARIKAHVRSFNEKDSRTKDYSDDIKKRLEYLRKQIKNESISYGEISELQSLAKYIEPGDVLLLEWAGVPERRKTKDSKTKDGEAGTEETLPPYKGFTIKKRNADHPSDDKYIGYYKGKNLGESSSLQGMKDWLDRYTDADLKRLSGDSWESDNYREEKEYRQELEAEEKRERELDRKEAEEKEKAKTKDMDTYTACSIVEGFDGEEHTQDEIIKAWQSLIDSGVVWGLQGWYGRSASDLIRQGLCRPKGGRTKDGISEEETAKQAIRIILSDRDNYGGSLNYAINYARAAMSMTGRELQVQCIYILENLKSWRHPQAKEVREALKKMGKTRDSMVRLTDNTTGEVRGIVKEGDSVEVELTDENGNPIKKRGIVAEVLTEDTYTKGSADKKTKDATNWMGDRSFRTYEAWKRACKQIDPNVKFDGDKDICQAGNIGEWDGNEGIIYTKDSKTKDAGTLKEEWDMLSPLERRKRFKLPNQPLVYGKWDDLVESEMRMVERGMRLFYSMTGGEPPISKDSKTKDGEDQLIGNYNGYRIVFNGGFIKAQEDGFTKFEIPSSMGAGGWSQADVQKIFSKIDERRNSDSKTKDSLENKIVHHYSAGYKTKDEALTLSEAIKLAKKELYPDKDYSTLNSTEHDNVTIKARELMSESKTEDVIDPSQPKNIASTKRLSVAQGKAATGQDFKTKDNYAEELKRLRAELEKAEEDGDEEKVKDLKVEIRDFIKETADSKDRVGGKRK